MSRGPNVAIFQLLLAAGFFVAMMMKSWRLRPAPHRSRLPLPAPHQSQREMGRLLQLPTIALVATPAGDARSSDSPVRSQREVPPSTMAGLPHRQDSRYSVYLMLASVAALIALGVMYAGITGGSHTNRSVMIRPLPLSDSERAGGVSAETSGPDVAGMLLDSRRKLDLGELRDALDAYANFAGEYPTTWGAWSPFCVDMGNRGCLVVVAHGGGLHTTSGMQPYWYASDGHNYTLLAQVSEWPNADECPEVLPPEVIDTPVFCVSGAVPNR